MSYLNGLNKSIDELEMLTEKISTRLNEFKSNFYDFVIEENDNFEDFIFVHSKIMLDEYMNRGN